MSSDGPGSTAKIAMGTAGALGCLTSPVVLLGTVVVVIVIGGLGVILAPLILLVQLFGGGGSDPAIEAEKVMEVFQGDGKGELDPAQVPSDLLEPIKAAGALCEAIGPVVIAAQLERESDFDPNLVRPDGAQGISQLPPAVFTELGTDENDNGKVSAFDADDSIMAQGRHMCALAGEVRILIDNGQAIGTVLDLTLAAYDADIDAVRQAGGIPTTNQSQGYVVGIRALLAKYEGIGAPPTSFAPTPTPTSPTTVPTPSESPSESPNESPSASP
ncbi:lytic transglycosylase domain-containing protein [Streptomyces sp. NPDC048560]|uniref:lytic transglycosylase domain-containing protein n=1 Tax=Streptomyces sp. NPDC048560 TaxID=3155488 RepID=UPI003431BD39